MHRDLSITFHFADEDELTAFLDMAKSWEQARLDEARKRRIEWERSIVAKQCENCAEKCGGINFFPSVPYCKRGEEAIRAAKRMERWT